jgi:ubiquinone/menaquinone biosynthesis C-methylase UbiE
LLELGCGPGSLWSSQPERIRPGWLITLSDLSPGMLDEARDRLDSLGLKIDYRAFDAQSIPFEDGTFDALIANHMLYHVPDRPKALAEIRRVLKPGGALIAATNGKGHMRDLDELVFRLIPEARIWKDAIRSAPFTLENGRAQLEPFFEDIQMQLYPDELIVTEPEPLIAYVLSGDAKHLLQGELLAQFRADVGREIAEKGAIRIGKSSGLYNCHRR